MKQRLYRPLLTVGVLLLAILACMPSLGPAATEPPAQEPSVAAVVETDTPAPPAAEQYFTEGFDTGATNWSQAVAVNGQEGDGDITLAKVSVEDGRLVFDLDKWLLAYDLYDPYEYEDVRIDATVENRGTNVNDVLLICRYSDEGHYLVNVANSGLFAIYAYDGAKNSYARLADGGSKKIKPGKETNVYGLVCRDRDISLYVNGDKARTFTDNQYVLRKGKIGVGVASENLVPVKVEFDTVAISQP